MEVTEERVKVKILKAVLSKSELGYAKDALDYKKEYNRICQEVAKMLVDNRRNYETPMTPFELLSKWDKIREVK